MMDKADWQVSKSQDDEIGDGTTGVVGELPDSPAQDVADM
jgi:hypothetical protein